MEALLFLIPASLFIAGLFLWLFIGATRSGQFEDLESPAQRVLLEDHLEKKEGEDGA